MGVGFTNRKPTDLTVATTWTHIFDAAVAIVAKCTSSGVPGQVVLGSSMIVTRQFCA